jgi:hypothetical protein
MLAKLDCKHCLSQTYIYHRESLPVVSKLKHCKFARELPVFYSPLSWSNGYGLLYGMVRQHAAEITSVCTSLHELFEAAHRMRFIVHDSTRGSFLEQPVRGQLILGVYITVTQRVLHVVVKLCEASENNECEHSDDTCENRRYMLKRTGTGTGARNGTLLYDVGGAQLPAESPKGQPFFESACPYIHQAIPDHNT